ncbi:MAG: YeeE/YedE thiosulfate transporter family protein [Verrucomicrobiia bacterium]|jgi:hypothetical protein
MNQVPFRKRAWPLWVGAIALAAANVGMFAFMRAIGVFPQLSMWGAQVYNLAGVKVDAPFTVYPLTPLLLDVHSMINFGIVLGVAAAALLSEEFKLRKEHWTGYVAALAGGVLMGFGTVIMPPCNVGGFYSATMALSLSGPLTVLGLLPGAYLGGLLMKWQTQRAVAALDFSAMPKGEPVRARSSSAQPLIGAAVSAVLLAAAGYYASVGLTKHAGLLLFGALFGVIFQRSRLCFTSAFREILISGNGTLMKWVLVSIALGTIGFAILKANGYQPMHFVLPVGVHTVAGAFIFGVGMSLAGGCGIGVLWRSAEGYTRAWVALLAGMMTAGSWVLIYGKHVGEGWLYGKPVSLAQYGGYVGGTAIVFLFLAAFYGFILFVEARKRERA